MVSFLQGDLKISEDQISEETQKKIDKIEKMALLSSHWTIEWHRYKETKPKLIIE